jgi:hypothetical protein
MSPLVPYTRQGENFVSIPDPDKPRPHLLYSLNNAIRLHLDDKNVEYLIAERPAWVKALAIHDNRLVHAENYVEAGNIQCLIFRTETNELIAERPTYVEALAVHDGLLVDAGRYLHTFRTETEERIDKHSLLYINALTVYKGSLVGADDHHIVYVETGGIICERNNGAHALAVHDDRLVHAENRSKSKHGFLGSIFYTENRKQIASRSDYISSIATYKGRLIDAVDAIGIRYTETEDPIVRAGGLIHALLPIDDETADRLLTLPGVRELK